MIIQPPDRRAWSHVLPWLLPFLLIPLAFPLLELLRLLDSGICAQLATHVLTPGGTPLPLCARNTGIYTGAALTFGILQAQGRHRSMRPPSPQLIALLLALIGIMGLDGLNSVAADLALPHPYPPSNALRLATGLGAGTALALLLSPVVARARFGPTDQRPPLSRPAALWPFAAAAIGAYTVIWSTAAWTLYPVAFLSNTGLFAVLGGANVVAFDALRGLARQAPGPGGTNPPLVMLVVASAVELGALATLKQVLLGSGLM